MSVEWVTGTNRETGRAFIATNDGNRVDSDIEQLPHIAVALSGLYYSIDAFEREVNGNRDFVASEWQS